MPMVVTLADWSGLRALVQRLSSRGISLPLAVKWMASSAKTETSSGVDFVLTGIKNRVSSFFLPYLSIPVTRRIQQREISFDGVP
ncbi:hypothetical protein TNCV_3965041 [Trichonephila clavipes]|nr:hypothetical protein TNCV_3965041 [Trichonephila clavipes]